VFLHRVQDGPASRSYGLQVAALAGVPPSVTQRAQALLAELERSSRQPRTHSAVQPELPLFESVESAAQQKLDQLDPDQLSPRDALAALYELKRLRATERKH
jgi:DNA mismatch repair protein MutS